MTISANKRLCTLAVLVGISLLLASCGQQKPGWVIGCSNNTAGMLMNYALSHSGGAELSAYPSEGMASYLLVDCCSSKSTWSLNSGELDAAILCPDAAAVFLAESEGYRIAGELSYGTEALVYKDGTTKFDVIGYMSGQNRQRRALEALYPDAGYMPVIMTSLSYALHVDEVDAAVLDLSTAVTLDYPYIILADSVPTTVLVVSDEFYRSAEYPALILIWENAKAAIGEYEPFCEAMTFLFSEEVGRKEYEKWLSAEEKLFPALKPPETPW